MKYQCQQCSHQINQWAGQCPKCNDWNTLIEVNSSKKDKRQLNFHGYSGAKSEVIDIKDVVFSEETKLQTSSKELNRVLGGGLVTGSVILLGGDPGIGKSTLLLQVLANLSTKKKVIYVTGEESLQQVGMRAKRLGLKYEQLKLFIETNIETIIQVALKEQPSVMVIDSIQTIYTDTLSATPGGVSQLKESTQLLVRFAKSTGITLFIVGHVTKEAALAGPRVLEHMVDTVLYFEGERDSRFRMIRAIKNRFGAVNELGLFAMTDIGLKDVSNPSAIFLSNTNKDLSGSVLMVTKEGSRPLLIEIQALVASSQGQPRRICVGIDNNRLAMLLAVINRHGGVQCYDNDIFINVVGGVKITETGSDLALILAILSSLKDIVIPSHLICFGEVGLAGEIRPVANGQERILEAEKHGMTTAIILFSFICI
jgi:DNA repair protein RadA/Sms